MIHPENKLASYQKQCGCGDFGFPIFAFLSISRFEHTLVTGKNLNTEEAQDGENSASDFLHCLPSSVLKLFFI